MRRVAGFGLSLVLCLCSCVGEPTGAQAAEPPTECDRLAGYRQHADVRGSGVGWLNIDAGRAIAACEAEVQAAPDTRRLRFQLGRALLVGRQFERARSEINKAIELGDAQAMLLLATMQQQGLDGSYDHAEAFRLALRAADTGLAAAFDRLGYYYQNGIGVPYDAERAFDYARKAAEAGSLAGMRRLAGAYAEGLGTPKNAALSQHWQKRLAESARTLAESGDGAAMRELALALQRGWAGPVDHVQAVAWHRKAVEAGETPSLHALGWHTERGLGVEKNETLACDHYERSAAEGAPGSLNNLGLCFERGKGRPKDPSQALRLYERASLAGDRYAPRNLAKFYIVGSGVAQDLAKATALYRLSAERGLPAGMLDYATVLIRGQGVPANLVAGCDWFEKAAKLRQGRSTYYLATCYLSGEGRPKDIARGLALLEDAIALKDDLAMRDLARRLLSGAEVPRDGARATELLRRSAEAGSSQGMMDYGAALLVGLGGAKNEKAGCDMLKRAGEAGIVDATFVYGHCLEEGLIGRKQPKEALAYYERAGATGHTLAIQSAARVLDEGRAGKRDGTRAARWLRKGIAAGDSHLVSALIGAPQAWSLDTRRALQRLLKDEGRYAGPVDGRFTVDFDDLLWSAALISKPEMADGRLVQEIVRVPVAGAKQGIVVRVCHARSSGAKALVVINHGLTSEVAKRRQLRASPCGDMAEFFAERGYIVAFPVRRGYGETGGNFAETKQVDCKAPASLARGSHEIARDIKAVINHLSARADVRPESTIVIGHSGGGWGALSLAGDAPKGVVGIVNVSGTYASRDGKPDSYCSGTHVAAALALGKAAKLPSLWLYFENDSYVGPRLARQMHEAFARGPSKSELVVLPKFENEGHYAFRDNAVEVWGPTLDKWLSAASGHGVGKSHSAAPRTARP